MCVRGIEREFCVCCVCGERERERDERGDERARAGASLALAGFALAPLRVFFFVCASESERVARSRGLSPPRERHGQHELLNLL